MSSLISLQEMSGAATVFQNTFDTYSRNIIIYKQPIKTEIIPQNSSALFGFGASQSQELYTYVPVTGIYPAVIRYATRYASETKDDVYEPEINEYITEGPVAIKIRPDCYNFINNGKTEKIQIDNFMYIVDGSDARSQTLWGNTFYILELERKL